MTDELNGILTPEQLVDLAMFDLGMGTSTEGLPDADIVKIIKYIGIWATPGRNTRHREH